MDGRIRLEYVTCGRENFGICGKKVAVRIKKYLGMCGQGLKESRMETIIIILSRKFMQEAVCRHIFIFGKYIVTCMVNVF